jgi:hypothetical protein
MEMVRTPKWFATPDGGSIYALLTPDRLEEHQRLGRRYLHHVLEVRTYADRLHVVALLERVANGDIIALEEDEYDERIKNIEQLERWESTGE